MRDRDYLFWIALLRPRLFLQMVFWFGLLLIGSCMYGLATDPKMESLRAPVERQFGWPPRPAAKPNLPAPANIPIARDEPVDDAPENRVNRQNDEAERIAKRRRELDEEAARELVERELKNEKLAAAKLRSAESLLKEGKQDGYRRTLAELVKKYPKTKAAEKARLLLR